jgi:hypothetical protein
MNKVIMNNTNEGIGTLSILGIVFITLKLTEYINWSWWFVLMPLYAIPVMALIYLGVLIIYSLYIDKKKRKELKKIIENE